MAKKTFQNEWIFDSFSEEPTFLTKRMFGGLAVYLHGRQMVVLVEPTKSGRWDWNGILICTSLKHHESLIKAFSELNSHEAIKKWLYIDSLAADFEETMKGVIKLIVADDPRIGVYPKLKR